MGEVPSKGGGHGLARLVVALLSGCAGGDLDSPQSAPFTDRDTSANDDDRNDNLDGLDRSCSQEAALAAQQFALKALAPAPSGQAPTIRRARRYLVATHASVSGLMDSFNVVHEKTVTSRQNAQGRLGRDEADLLRAALVFTSSGLDASCHTLVAECLPGLVERPESTAAKKFDLYLDEMIASPTETFKAALRTPQPRDELVRLYVEAKTKASYQGSGDVKGRVRDLIGIPNKALASSRITAMDGFFVARNDIVHRLDYVEPGGPSTKRHLVLAVIAELITGAADVMRAK